MLNLADQHSLEIDEGRPTVRPSILVADAPCLSHFWLTGGLVSNAESWSATAVQEVMTQQLHRHLTKAAAKRAPWWMRLIRAIQRRIGKRG
jgi:hypothetical protein